VLLFSACFDGVLLLGLMLDKTQNIAKKLEAIKF
jgi:hypothetical protein